MDGLKGMSVARAELVLVVYAVRRYTNLFCGIPPGDVDILMDDYLAIVSACLAVIVAVYVVRWYNDPLRAIPTVGGSSLPVLSYLGAWRMRGDCRDVLEEAYRKYAGSAFKIAYLDRWMVVVSGRNMVEEIRKRADELSGAHAIQEEMLVRKRSTILRGVIDEVAVAVGDRTVADENEWSSVEVMPAMRKIVARASNRVIVGLPLCRDEDYLALVFNFAAGFMKSTFILRFFPVF
ncbi:hypothetical protein GSI_07451 [Ganoderma sinense ZZ0214-1]|uniref:Uncharacterized protein n=1 Tax=Ganoderma sinense ZZ0214-1 TaxID=1077348 RepID=A0A2G8S925_9APHY|nr:hypothetical protein GSI_07451 [Ganoderma sinense ZZ0214-1]